jgi:hypothetical protein
MGGPIRGMVMFRDIAVVVRAHVAPDGRAAIIVDQGYYGPYQVGERVPVLPDAYRDELLVPGGSQPEMFLVLEHVPAGSDDSTFGPYLFAKGLTIEPFFGMSRRLSDGRVYFWPSNTKTASYRFWSHLTNTASLERDEDHPNLAALEDDLREGLARHDEWWRAKAATDPAERLALLRPFLLPGGPHHLNEYEVWSCTQAALEQVEKAGPAAVPFLRELLTEPSFQDSYAPQDWPGWGTGERDMVKRSLALVEARDAVSPQEKLAKVKPVFETIHFGPRRDLIGMARCDNTWIAGWRWQRRWMRRRRGRFCRGCWSCRNFRKGTSRSGRRVLARRCGRRSRRRWRG